MDEQHALCVGEQSASFVNELYGTIGEHMALWSGRFQQGVDASTQEFGASLEVDKAMAMQDIAGSLAHATMLAEQNIISTQDAEAITQGLLAIKEQIQTDSFVWDINDEDIHMAIERALTQHIGSAGARLHTGRSRNDQVACDLRLLAKDLCQGLLDANVSLRACLYELATKYQQVILPGYTHLQHAQPVRFSHHLLAYFWMFTRDYKRLRFAYEAADANPLGAAALAGTSYPIDRQRTTELLGFSGTIPNSLDAVSDRDFLVDLCSAVALSMTHLSRLAEELIFWSSAEVGFVALSDTFSTGSSIMPQKKNPDFAELIRGKVGRTLGDLTSLLVTLKALPLAYNKDLQETKEAPLDAAKTLRESMQIMEGMLATMTLCPERMEQEAARGFSAATDVADFLAKQGMPFREAHRIVGELVLYCEQHHKDLDELSDEELQAASELLSKENLPALDVRSVADVRTSYGGTSLEALQTQLAEAKRALTETA